jgi:hypothetical protein
MDTRSSPLLLPPSFIHRASEQEEELRYFPSTQHSTAPADRAVNEAEAELIRTKSRALNKQTDENERESERENA